MRSSTHTVMVSSLSVPIWEHAVGDREPVGAVAERHERAAERTPGPHVCGRRFSTAVSFASRMVVISMLRR